MFSLRNKKPYLVKIRKPYLEAVADKKLIYSKQNICFTAICEYVVFYFHIEA